MPFTPKTVAVLNIASSSPICVMYYADSDNNIRKAAYRTNTSSNFTVSILPDSQGNDIEITENGFYLKAANTAYVGKAYYIASA